MNFIVNEFNEFRLFQNFDSDRCGINRMKNEFLGIIRKELTLFCIIRCFAIFIRIGAESFGPTVGFVQSLGLNARHSDGKKIFALISAESFELRSNLDGVIRNGFRIQSYSIGIIRNRVD